MTLELIDFHCHLDLYPDHAAVVAECERKRVHTLTVTTTPKAWPHNYNLAVKTRYVLAALGIHPQLVAERAGELALWEKYLPQARYIGEVGLDAGPRFYPSLGLQKQVFERVLKLCARAGGKVLTVHTVRSTTAVLDMIETHLRPPRGQVVLHWFTGSQAEARRAIDLGCYFSINAQMLRSERHKNLVSALPLERLLTETDGPFTQHNGCIARPVDVAVTVDLLARIRKLDFETIALALQANCRALLSVIGLERF